MAQPLNFRFNANQQSGSSYRPSLLKRESVSVDCMQRASLLHGLVSALQNLSTTPVNGVVVCLSMLSDRRLVSLAFNTGVLVLLVSSSEASLGLSDVDLSTCAWYLVYDIHFDRERVFDFSKHGPESRAFSASRFDASFVIFLAPYQSLLVGVGVVGVEMQVPVRVCGLAVYSYIKLTILLSSYP